VLAQAMTSQEFLLDSWLAKCNSVTLLYVSTCYAVLLLAEFSEILDNSFMVQTSSCHVLLLHCNIWNRFPAIVLFILHDDNGHIELMIMLVMLSWI
jgi:hypothetical protein